VSANIFLSAFVKGSILIIQLHNKNMAGHIGIVACSTEGAALCYRTICMEGVAVMGAHSHPEITIHTYHPFGEVSTQEGTEYYTFTGKELDETGLYYYGAWYYDPDLGRFITRDSLMGHVSNPQRLNRFAYCQNNPLSYTDPWGESYKPTEPCIEGGGDVDEPEITGDPVYEGNGVITIPTSEGDVTIDSKKEENIGDWEDKARDKAREKEHDKLRKELEKAEEKILAQRKESLLSSLLLAEVGFNLMGVGGIPCLESDEEKDMKYAGAAILLIVSGVSFTFGGIVLTSIGLAEGVALATLVGLGFATFGVGLIIGGILLSLYGASKMTERER
jgi:RHS repeat-associated protein